MSKESERGLETQNVKNRFVNHFGNTLGTNCQSRNNISEAPIGEAIEWNYEHLNKREETETHHLLLTVKSCGGLIRDEILSQLEAFSTWPTNEKELLSQDVSKLPLLDSLLLTILSSSNKKTERLNQVISSVDQDLLYNSTSGQKKLKNMHS